MLCWAASTGWIWDDGGGDKERWNLFLYLSVHSLSFICHLLIVWWVLVHSSFVQCKFNAHSFAAQHNLHFVGRSFGLVSFTNHFIIVWFLYSFLLKSAKAYDSDWLWLRLALAETLLGKSESALIVWVSPHSVALCNAAIIVTNTTCQFFRLFSSWCRHRGYRIGHIGTDCNGYGETWSACRHISFLGRGNVGRRNSDYLFYLELR